jgi:predicted DNA-binding transcriptional regulator YafY
MFKATEEVEKDAWEDWGSILYNPATARELEAKLRIAYIDRAGQKTHRTIDVQRFAIDDSGGGLVVGFCHLRKARRPFQIAGITHAVDMQQLATIPDLSKWLSSRYEVTPKGSRDQFINQHESALGALLYVAKADDAFRAKEKSILLGFCETLGGLNSEAATLVVDEVGSWITPSAIQFGKDLRSVAGRDTEYQNLVLETAIAFVASDKTVRENETRAIERMKKTLGDAKGKTK